MFEVHQSHGDFREASCEVPVKTWIFDPPYNVGYQYGEKVNDSMNRLEYLDFIGDAGEKMWDMSEPDANLFYINYQEQCARTFPILESKGWVLKQWITWVYPSNIGMSKRKCTRASRGVLWFTKGNPEAFMDATVQPYRNPNDKRVKAQIAKGKKGTHHYDWWSINLRKNVSKGFAGYYNQLPAELVERCILLSTSEGDVVGDLMAGSGSHIRPSVLNGRIPYMNDIDDSAPGLWHDVIIETWKEMVE